MKAFVWDTLSFFVFTLFVIYSIHPFFSLAYPTQHWQSWSLYQLSHIARLPACCRFNTQTHSKAKDVPSEKTEQSNTILVLFIWWLCWLDCSLETAWSSLTWTMCLDLSHTFRYLEWDAFTGAIWKHICVWRISSCGKLSSSPSTWRLLNSCKRLPI